MRKEKNTIKVKKNNINDKKYNFIYSVLLFFLNVNAAEKKDCSMLKKLSKDYWICKKNNLKASTDDVGFDTSNIKKKKTLADWFKKK